MHNSVVRGRCHLNVSAIIKKVPEDTDIKIVVHRDDKNKEKLAVQRLTQFPSFLDDAVSCMHKCCVVMMIQTTPDL